MSAILLTGCSSRIPDSDGAKPAADSTDTAASTQNGGEVRVVSVDTGSVVAEQEYTIPGTKDKVKFGVQPVALYDKTMALKIVSTPDFASASDTEKTFVYDLKGTASFTPTLIDKANLTEYLLISDTGQTWSTDRVFTATTNHEPVMWWGEYAAPEDNNETFEICVLDAMAEFTDLPVQR